MGAYENPDVVIDTQSGQHIRNMISGLSGTAISVIKEFKAKEDAFAKKRNEFGTEVITSTNQIAGKVDKGSTFNIKPMTDTVKNILMPLSTDAVSNDFTKSSAALNDIQVKQGQFKKTAESVVTELPLYLDTMKTAISKLPFTKGAVYSEAPPEYMEFAQALVQNKGANASVDFMKNEKGEYDLTDAVINYSMTSLGGKEIKPKEAYSLSAILNKNKVFPDGEYTIPSMKEDDAIKSLSNVFNVKEGKIEEGLSEMILKDPKYVKTGKKPMGQSVKGDKSGKVVSAGDYITDIVDRDAIADDSSVTKVTGAEINAMLQTNPRGLAMYANDVLRRQFPDVLPKITNIDDVSEIAKYVPQITAAYSRALVYKQLPNPEIIKKDAAGNPVYVKNTTEKVEGGGGTDNNATELTPAQKRDVAFVQDRWKEVKNGHGEYPLNEAGTILYKEDKLYKVIKDPTIPNSIPKLVPLPNSLKKYYGLIK